ncbi:aminopeptidase P N-terminal domain-containing protein [Pseudoduganella violaceinigra]|uniref:aminopeptidase P N-terminal domain-containing protein n=1 Tax=Pseudoduganella violaceinigra TaxID=246602 RepID=UPI0004179B3E|nr:aminopeptidase P N-terminal domain-containing protein [Pseudoduganella violaceinigra]
MKPYSDRRARLLAMLEPGSVAVIGTAPEVARNADTEYPYRHDSSFYYLTGFAEPEAVLVLAAARGASPAQAILFCREKHPESEIWDGYRYGPDAARAAFGFDAAYPVGALDEHMVRQLSNASALYAPLARGGEAQQRRWFDGVRKLARGGTSAPPVLRDLPPLVDDMRLFKDDHESAVMLRAGAISCGAHARAMRFAGQHGAGIHEYELEAELLHEFRRHGAQYPAYTPIVASGPNACVLHYNANNRRIQDGDLVLIDAGCELDGYASDITRTFPVNGRFSAAQRALYELVLAAQQAAFDAIRPGRKYHDAHDAAVRVLAQGMLDLGLLQGALEDVLAEKRYAQFYMHGTGHWIGMDVHDVGLYRDTAREDKPSRLLQPGMAMTVEPGIYVRPAGGVPEKYWNIGIRIEDDVIVREGGFQLLTGGAPKTVAEIEALMK